MRTLAHHLRYAYWVGMLPDYLLMASATVLVIDSLHGAFPWLVARLFFCVGVFQVILLMHLGVAHLVGRYVNALAAVALWIAPHLVCTYDWVDGVIHGVLSGMMFHYLFYAWRKSGS